MKQSSLAKGPALAKGLALASVILLSGSSAQARFDGGGGGGAAFRGGGGFSGASFGGGGGGGGGAYRFSAPRIEAAPIERSAPAVPRISGGGGAGGGGGWADKPADRSLEQGYQGSSHLYGSGTRSAWTGHNISADQFRRLNDGSWNGNRSWGSFDNDRFNRNINLQNNFYNRSYGGWNNGWANGGYWGSRPWGYGWYNWEPNTWGWWGGASVGWGLAALAGAEVITSLVNAAAEQQSPVIDVPDSDYQLNYGTVDSVGSGGADFSYAVAGSPPVKGAANCQQGLLDGQVPSTAAQAQLLNAACQVAYGPDPKGTPLPETLTGALPGWLRELLVLALGAGIAVGIWQVLERKRQQPPSSAGSGHHPTITSG
ncbi:hypothetical protein [Cyanobium sp. FACHB-13342]|uniref:hypothetical protein n=1 Tax=Cyanobium sp. FACHB-13342 TaxID=2692793 RepID=UPI001680056F|nr:hypothetical protein [Cyanobium sp. FACHB-13342]MBD2423359.1 hypothetical protein [Cyanobium sp. FACHB-13342]